MKFHRKMILPLMLAAILILGAPLGAMATAPINEKKDWSVKFTSGKKMESNFKTSDLDEVVRGMQPGDSAAFEIKLANEYDENTRWYMTNKVLYSLEDRSKNHDTAGGAYTYKLTYTNPKGKVTTLFDSNTVGGEEISVAGEGLHEATDALEDYFHLDDLTKGQAGTIDLVVSLDGETQGNDYQDTLADLQMNFAVELGEVEQPTTSTEETKKKTDRKVVKTGDDSDLIRYYIMGGVSGALLLVLGFVSLSARKKEEEASGRKGAK